MGVVQKDSFSTAIYVVCQAISWFLVFVVVTLEVWKTHSWPWFPVKVYLAVNLLANILITSVVLHNGSSSYEIGFAFTQFVLNVFLLLLAFLKDYLRTPEDIAKEELKRYSAEFLSSSPLRSSNDKSNLFTKVWNFFKSKEPEETINFGSNRYSTEKGRFSWLSGDKQAAELDEFDAGGHRDYNSKHEFEASFRSSMSSVRNVSMVESAIDRNSMGGSNSMKKESQTILQSLFNWNNGYATVKDEDELDKYAPLLTTEQEEQLFIKEEMPRYVPTKAINKVMEQHQAKISASNPILEPRGTETTIVFNTYTETSRNTLFNPVTKDNSMVSPSVQKDTDNLRYNVSVQRWGIRKSDELGKTRSSEFSNDVDRLSFGGREKAEIEFEVIISAQFITGKTSEMITDNEFGSNDKQNSIRWTVWRTASEINKLHSMMVSDSFLIYNFLLIFVVLQVLLLGDLTPRPPRLKSSQTSTNFTHAELISDMRSITIFLNALLRLKDGSNMKPVADFLELERAKVLVKPNTNDSIIDLIDRGGEASIRDSDQQDLMSESGKANNNNEAASGNNSPKNMIPTQMRQNNAPQSLMDAAEQDAANNPNNQHEKWRKLFYQMKIQLKPHDIAVRCRLFEGVISGGEIAGWLIRSTSAAPDVNLEKTASNRAEACAIGQELVSCGLILTVCGGFIEDDHEMDMDAADFEATDRSSMMQLKAAPKVHTFKPEDFSKFSDMPGFIFRFPLKSGTAGSWSLFGAPITVKIPITTTADENENMKSTRDTVVLTIDNAGFADAIEESSTPTTAPTAGGHVKYLIDITHGEDKWQTVKR
jgi:hypothetical protein